MKKILALVACLSLVASLAVGGSIAYLQDQKATVNVMTLGNVDITIHEYERATEENGEYSKKTITDNGTDYTSYVLKGFTQEKPLLPIVGDPSEPEDSPAYAGWDTTATVRMSQVDSYGGMSVFAGKNAIDKFVTIENTGKSDAFVRTYIAFEVGSADPALIKMNRHENAWLRTEIGTVNIKDNQYNVFEFVYQGAKLSDGSWRHEKGILPAGDTTYPSLSQVYLKHTATNEDLEAIDGNKNGMFDILVLSQAVQAAGFDNAADALNTAFGEATAINPETNIANIADWFGSEDFTSIIPVTVKNADELAAAVAAGKTNITLADGVYDVYGCGGKTLTLSGSRKAILKLKNEGEDGCDYAFGGPEGVGNVTFKGVTIDTTENTGNYKGFAYMKGTFNDCAFVGAYSLNNANDFEFNNCEFDFKNGYFWTWGANSVTFNNCTFNGNSKNILAHGYASTKININDCNFAATEVGTTSNGTPTAAVEIDPAGNNTYTITFSGNNTKTDKYNGWTRIKDGSTGHTITGVN